VIAHPVAGAKEGELSKLPFFLRAKRASARWRSQKQFYLKSLA
jgi:hypothetical protein